MKINFLPVLYTRTPSEEALTPKNTHWPKPGQAYFRQNASIGWHYPTLTCDIKVNRKVRKRRYWNTPCFTIQRAHPPMLWPLVARPWDQALVSLCTLYIYALDKPASILLQSYNFYSFVVGMPLFFANYSHQVTCFSIHQLLSCPSPSFPIVMY